MSAPPFSLSSSGGKTINEGFPNQWQERRLSIPEVSVEVVERMMRMMRMMGDTIEKFPRRHEEV
jgi:hypothetical protein